MNILINKRKAFTPIELLFVFLILGVLIVISLFFLNSSRLKARDAKRVVDIRRIQTVLEFYNLQYDEYPYTESSIVLGIPPYQKLCDKESGGFVSVDTACVKEFMTIIPNDPKSNFTYVYSGLKEGFTIKFNTEGETSLGVSNIYYAHSNKVNNDPKLQ